MVSEHRAPLLCQSGAGSVNLILSPEGGHRASIAGDRIGSGLCNLGDTRPDGGLVRFAGTQKAVLRTRGIGADDDEIGGMETP